jgi:hypothetical protein
MVHDFIALFESDDSLDEGRWKQLGTAAAAGMMVLGGIGCNQKNAAPLRGERQQTTQQQQYQDPQSSEDDDTNTVGWNQNIGRYKIVKGEDGNNYIFGQGGDRYRSDRSSGRLRFIPIDKHGKPSGEPLSANFEEIW